MLDVAFIRWFVHPRFLLYRSQPEMPEEEMDVRGGGQAFEDKRVRHTNDYDTDDEEVGPAHSAEALKPPSEDVAVKKVGLFCGAIIYG